MMSSSASESAVSYQGCNQRSHASSETQLEGGASGDFVASHSSSRTNRAAKEASDPPPINLQNPAISENQDNSRSNGMGQVESGSDHAPMPTNLTDEDKTSKLISKATPIESSKSKVLGELPVFHVIWKNQNADPLVFICHFACF